MRESDKYIICVDVDGVIHSYVSGWHGADQLNDPPVPGAIAALHTYLETFEVAIYSARSGHPGGIQAIRAFIDKHDTAPPEKRLIDRLLFPSSKPAAALYLDDRGYRFEGVFPETQTLMDAMVPWYQKRENSWAVPL